MVFSSKLRGYKIVYKTSASKELRKVPPGIAKKIALSLSKLVSGADGLDIKKIVQKESTYRLRVNDYRVIYTVEHECITVLVIRIGHRKNIYDL